VHTFSEINPNFIAELKECGGLFHRLVKTANSADNCQLVEAANFCVVRFMTGSDNDMSQINGGTDRMECLASKYVVRRISI
jgi:hypothetical protein